MPQGGITLVLRRNDLPAVLAHLVTRSTAAVDDTTTAIRDRCEQTSPRDTGALASSWYTNNGQQSDYTQRAGTAHAQNGLATIVSEVSPEFVLSLFGDNTGYLSVVASAVAHAVYQEFGTRHMSAQPTLIPATEGERENFIQAMSHVADV